MRGCSGHDQAPKAEHEEPDMTATVTGDVKALSDACRFGSDFLSPF
jgi:hypothetical protein